MWFFLLLYVAHIAQVTSQGGENWVILKDGGDPCEGHVEVLHKGQWGYVGDTNWNKTTEAAVCKITHCGKPTDSTQDVLRSMDRPVWLNEIICNKTDDFNKCDHPGWNISYYRKDSVKKIKCSKRIMIGFHQSPFTCAGAVMYSSSEGDMGYFCGDVAKYANMLCKSLDCGESKEVLQDEWMVLPKNQNLEKMSINCASIDINNLDNLWQCASPPKQSCTKPVSVICTGHKRLRVRGKEGNVCSGRLEREEDGKWNPVKNLTESSNDWCKQIHCGENPNHAQDNKGKATLTCPKKVKVVLTNRGQCYGEVQLEVDGKSHAVCGSGWSQKNAEVVCKELDCGGVLHHKSKNLNARGLMDNVNCLGKEPSLWHCMAKRSDDPFQCSSKAYVVCTGSIDARLADGPGKCAGRVELLYEGQWQGVAERNSKETGDVVCTHLKCGKQRKTEKFSQGSGVSLDLSCETSDTPISKCTITQKDNKPQKTADALGITCEKHKVVFLNESTCSGMVGIEHGKKTYWLSGSNNTWNQNSADTVCRQMHCGNATSYNSTPSADMMKDVWRKSYNCLSNSTSLFECENTLPSDHNDTVASVTCSGNISVNLTEKCWGYVNICAGGKCDGLCNATWTYKMSQMLCENLGCKNAMPDVNHRKEGKVIFKSLHMTEHATSLSQSNLVKNEDEVLCEKAYVVCSGSVRADINISSYRSKCSGNVEMYYEGQWLPVCKSALDNTETQNIICGEQNCGRPLKVFDYAGPRTAKPRVISKIGCPADGNALNACNISDTTDSCILGHLTCSRWSQVELKNGQSCDGAVFVHTEGKRSPVSSEGWTETASKQLCKDLKCGEPKSNKTNKSKETIGPAPWHTSFNCDDVKTPQNIWKCENETSSTKPSQTQAHIECQGEPDVNFSEHCHGHVRINNFSVCSNDWKPEYSGLVCQQLKCGNVLSTPNFFESKTNVNYEVDAFHVSCENYHYNLGQCNRFRTKCKELVYVYCTDSVKFNTTEHCGGYVKVSYGKEKEEYLCPAALAALSTPDLKNKLCSKLNCTSHKSSKTENQKAALNIKAELTCTEDHNDIRRCINFDKKETKCNAQPAMIFCEGYVPVIPKPPEQAPNHTVPIILGIGFLLIVVILIIVFIRIRTARRAKRPINVSSRMLPGNEVESESGEYEPVTSKENEMDRFSNDRFRSEAEVIMEGDVRSTSSYDDVDEAAEAQPLTSPTTPVGASGVGFFGDGAINQSLDGVTYEVEDPQENYDDIEASPEFVETKAEVHDVPEPALESVTVATPGMVQGEEDYLVPGQDR